MGSNLNIPPYSYYEYYEVKKTTITLYHHLERHDFTNFCRFFHLLLLPSSQHIDQELIELLHFFLPSKTMPTLILRMMQSASRRAANLLRTLRSIYHHHFFEQKKTANSTDSNKVAPEKKTQKNMVILDYYKFLSTNL